MILVLGEAALRTFLLAAIVGCSLRVARVRQPQLLLAAWTVVLAASLSMPMLSRLAPLHVPMVLVFPAMSIDGVGEVFPAAMLNRPDQRRPDDRSQPSLQEWVQVAYFAGTTTLAARLLLGIALSLRLMARSVPFRADWIAGLRVRISRDVSAPVTVAGTILLPPDAEGWPAETRRAVLAHERAHVARWDFLLLVLAQVNRAVFWFDPVSWWLHRKLVILTELASDDQAISVTGDHLSYAEVLLEMGRRSSPVWRGPAMARPSTLASRIDRILEQPAVAQRSGAGPRAVLVITVTGLSIATAGLVPDTTPGSATAPLLRQSVTLLIDVPDPMMPPVVGTRSVQSPVETEPEAPPLPLDAVAKSAPTAQQPPMRGPTLASAVSARRSSSVVPPSQRPSARKATHSMPALQPRSSTQDAGDRAAMIDKPSVDEDPRSATPSQGIQIAPSRSNSLDVEQAMSSTCTGHILVGLRARQSTQPNVVAGQAVESKAQFFRKENGAPWVRFFAFGRPPLDLPVRLAQGRMTWTGEYGISYAVQPWGENRLVGLAAQVAADSAQLDFACRTSRV